MNAKNTEKEKHEEALNSPRDNPSPLSRGLWTKIMLAKSHMALGLLGGLGANAILQANDAIILPLVVFGSILPDIDEPRSFIGRKLPLISHIISLSFTHRGFTHFFVFPLLIASLGLALGLYDRAYALVCFAIALGVFIHQIGDMLTISGIPYYFFPFSSKRATLLPSAFRFRTGSAVEKAIFKVILVPLVVLFGANYLGILNHFDMTKIIQIIGGLKAIAIVNQPLKVDLYSI